MSTSVVVAAHKEYKMPVDPLYIPVMAGSALMYAVPPGYVRDDTGDNISASNRTYCELTALYWAWKNLEADNIGICHYRRYFASPGVAAGDFASRKLRAPLSCFIRALLPRGKEILRGSEADILMDEYEVLLPAARNYLIETNYSQYAHAHHSRDLDLTREVISEKYPDHIDAYDRRMAMTTGHRFNMFIMRRELLDRYCEWLFSILFELEKRLDVSEYSDRDRRVFGFVGERLLDVWLDANGIRYAELPYIMTESEHLPAKAAGLVLRKVRAKAARVDTDV